MTSLIAMMNQLQGHWATGHFYYSCRSFGFLFAASPLGIFAVGCFCSGYTVAHFLKQIKNFNQT